MSGGINYQSTERTGTHVRSFLIFQQRQKGLLSSVTLFHRFREVALTGGSGVGRGGGRGEGGGRGRAVKAAIATAFPRLFIDVVIVVHDEEIAPANGQLLTNKLIELGTLSMKVIFSSW